MRKIYLLSVFFFFFGMSTRAQEHSLMLRQLSQEQLPASTLFHFPNAVQTAYYELDLTLLNTFTEVALPTPNQVLHLNFQRTYEYSHGVSSWYAKTDQGGGYAIFSFFNGAISGKAMSDDHQVYMIQQINATNIFAITQVQTDAMQEASAQDEDALVYATGGKPTKRPNADVCAAGSTCAGSSVVDLMVLGNAGAITDGGGSVASFTTNVGTVVTEMNTALTNSGVNNLSFNLVHADAYTFTTTASSSTDLGTFSNDVNVQNLRNTHKADLAGLWVGSGSYGSCGIGWLNTNATNYNDAAAFTVSDYSCATTNLTFAHECGHNMGLRHDWYVDNSTTPCSHHHGYVNQVVIPSGTPSTGRWRTIMAYNDQCSVNGFNCTRLPRWANPTLNYLGDPMGVAIGNAEPSNEAYAFERMGCVVSNFRINIAAPVVLKEFSGAVDGNDLLLNWVTSSEYTNSGFEIQYRTSLSDEYRVAGFVKGQGNSSQTHAYQFQIADRSPGAYYIRLAQYDMDGHVTYSRVIRLQVESEAMYYSFTPNPVTGPSRLIVYTPQKQTIRWYLSDMTGTVLLKNEKGLSVEGRQEVRMPTENLAPGMYLLQIQSSEGIKSLTMLKQ